MFVLSRLFDKFLWNFLIGDSAVLNVPIITVVTVSIVTQIYLSDNILQAKGILGQIGDFAVLEFPTVSIVTQMYLHFKYLINNWDHSNNLQYSINNGSQYNPVLLSKPYLPAWQPYCKDLGTSATVNLMFQAKKTRSDTDVSIDDVAVSADSCPGN